MAWGGADFFDGARTQAHALGVTRREVLHTAELAEFLMTNRFASGIDRAAVLREFGFARVRGGAGEFVVRIVPGRAKRPREIAAFFVLRPTPNPGVRFIGFSRLDDYRAAERSMNEALGLLAHFALQA